MQIQKFTRKPFTVEGVKVTEENLEEVAEWCLGEIQTNPKTNKRHIRVDAHRPLTERQTMAMIGDWVLFHNRGYKVYTEAAFSRNFELVEVDSHADHAEFQPITDPHQLELDLVQVAQDIHNAAGNLKTALANMQVPPRDWGDHQA